MRANQESEKVKGPKKSKKDGETKRASNRVGRMGHERITEKEDAYRIMRLATG